RWSFFAALIQQSPQILSSACTGEGGNKETTPFYWLSQSEKGRKLLKAHQDFFDKIDLFRNWHRK
ncbi:MAG: hypothetical protein ACOVOR_04145, partial [Rhabdochlamydiaceae bacterium]